MGLHCTHQLTVGPTCTLWEFNHLIWKWWYRMAITRFSGTLVQPIFRHTHMSQETLKVWAYWTNKTVVFGNKVSTEACKLIVQPTNMNIEAPILGHKLHEPSVGGVDPEKEPHPKRQQTWRTLICSMLGSGCRFPAHLVAGWGCRITPNKP